jgi:hypothetical protein
MDDEQGTTSNGTVIAYVFIILGILFLIARQFYHRNGIHSTTRLPGVLFMVTGVIILVVRILRKEKER